MRVRPYIPPPEAPLEPEDPDDPDDVPPVDPAPPMSDDPPVSVVPPVDPGSGVPLVVDPPPEVDPVPDDPAPPVSEPMFPVEELFCPLAPEDPVSLLFHPGSSDPVPEVLCWELSLLERPMA